MTTGFSQQRAATHDVLVERCAAWLTERGYQAVVQGVNGISPDIQIMDRDGKRAFVELKDPGPFRDRLAIAHRAFLEYERLTITGTPVYILWVHANQSVTVHTTHTLNRRIVGPPQRPNGNGSNTDFLLFDYKDGDGSPCDTFFAPRESQLGVVSARDYWADVLDEQARQLLSEIPADLSPDDPVPHPCECHAHFVKACDWYRGYDVDFECPVQRWCS